MSWISRGRVCLENLEVCGWFGRHLDNEYLDQDDERSTRVVQYLRMPSQHQLPFNLRLCHPGDEIRFNGTSYEHIFRWIMARNKDGAKNNPCHPPDARFVCEKDALTKMMRARYGNDSLVLHAQQIKGVIYFKCEWLDKFVLQKESGEYSMMSKEEIMRRQSAYTGSVLNRYGHKFKKYMLAEDPQGTPDPMRRVLRYEDMACVYRASIGRNNLLYAGNIDGLPTADALNNLTDTKFFDLKTVANKSSRFTQQFSFKKFKSLLWWAQGILGKMDSVLVGLRDDTRGLVVRLESINVNSLPSKGKGYWDADECIAFVNGLLGEMESRMLDDEPVALLWQPSCLLQVQDFPCKELLKTELVPQFYRDWLDTLPSHNP